MSRKQNTKKNIKANGNNAAANRTKEVHMKHDAKQFEELLAEIVTFGKGDEPNEIAMTAIALTMLKSGEVLDWKGLVKRYNSRVPKSMMASVYADGHGEGYNLRNQLFRAQHGHEPRLAAFEEKSTQMTSHAHGERRFLKGVKLTANAVKAIKKHQRGLARVYKALGIKSK